MSICSSCLENQLVTERCSSLLVTYRRRSSRLPQSNLFTNPCREPLPNKYHWWIFSSSNVYLIWWSWLCPSNIAPSLFCCKWVSNGHWWFLNHVFTVLPTCCGSIPKTCLRIFPRVWIPHTQQVRNLLLGFVAAAVVACPSIGLRALEGEELTRSSPIPWSSTTLWLTERLPRPCLKQKSTKHI